MAAGRRTLAEAVSEDRDWALRFSAEDRLIEVLGALSDPDLEAARLLAYHLDEALACVQIRRDMNHDAEKRGGGGEPS